MKTPNKLSTTPSVKAVDESLALWRSLPNYVAQESALDKLFFEIFKSNKSLDEILIKASTLNDFYSTNIFSIYSVGLHIQQLDIDKRLKAGDLSLVDDIAQVTIADKEHRFYSFASKYCSHHEPLKFAIYDSYVHKILMFFKRRDKFASFKEADLKDYASFIAIIRDFQRFYGLEKFNLKQIDQYLWQLGKQEFFKPAAKKSKTTAQKSK